MTRRYAPLTAVRVGILITGLTLFLEIALRPLTIDEQPASVLGWILAPIGAVVCLVGIVRAWQLRLELNDKRVRVVNPLRTVEVPLDRFATFAIGTRPFSGLPEVVLRTWDGSSVRIWALQGGRFGQLSASHIGRYVDELNAAVGNRTRT